MSQRLENGLLHGGRKQETDLIREDLADIAGIFLLSHDTITTFINIPLNDQVRFMS